MLQSEIDHTNHYFQSQLRKSQKLINKARMTNQLDLLNEAENILNEVLNVKPENMMSVFLMGCIFLMREQLGLAEILFTIVYRADKKFINAGNNLGVIYKRREQRKRAVEIHLECIETLDKHGEDIFPDKNDCDETLADLYGNIGSCLTNNGTPQEAMEYYEKSLSLKDYKDKDSPRFNMALAYLEMGDYKNGWENYKYYSIIHPERRTKNYSLNDTPTPKWQGDKSQVVAVVGEQGLGDELMFATMIPDIKKDLRIIFDCHPRLQTLFKNTWPDMPIFGTRKDKGSVWHGMVVPDAYIPISEMASFYRNEKSDFSGEAYLKPDFSLQELMPEFFNEEKKRPRVGFSWTGGSLSTNTLHRTIPYEQLFKLFDFNCDFISLQYKPEHNDELIQVTKERGYGNIHVFQEILNSYDLTALMLHQLDFIICAPQSVVYLAGALGVKCYQLCPKRGMWQQGVYGEDMVWFSSVKNIWQEKNNDWDSCIKESMRILNEAVNK